MTEAIAGFGSTVFAVAVGAHLYSIHTLVPVLVPLNILLSLYIVLRHGKAIDHPYLWGKILPWVLAGFPAGILIFNVLHGSALKFCFGLFIAMLSAYELACMSLTSKGIERKPHPASPLQRVFFLVSGGVMQGAYSSGGPLIVYSASREIADKERFRSTLSALWLLLNVFLTLTHILFRKTTLVTLKISMFFLPALIAGIAAGEWFHHRISEKAFRLFVFILLFLAGVSLVLTS